jgi:hypothetical protein
MRLRKTIMGLMLGALLVADTIAQVKITVPQKGMVYTSTLAACNAFAANFDNTCDTTQGAATSVSNVTYAF